jgi:hypothetical protein
MNPNLLLAKKLVTLANKLVLAVDFEDGDMSTHPASETGSMTDELARLANGPQPVDPATDNRSRKWLKAVGIILEKDGMEFLSDVAKKNLPPDTKATL